MANHNGELSAGPNSISRIAAGATIVKGEIHLENDIRVDGYFDGNLYCKSRVIIGETATIKGEIVCENLDIWGKFEGVVHTKDTLCLKSGCSFTGSIRSGKLSVELGAVFEGDSKVLSAQDYDKVFASTPNPIKAKEGKAVSGE